MNSKVYLCLYKGPVKIKNVDDVFAWLTHFFICIFTLDIASHSEVLINKRAYSSSIKDKGVRDKWINFSSGHWIVYETNADAVKALTIYAKHKSKKYDLAGALSFVFNFIKQAKNKLFCSELNAEMIDLPNEFLNKPLHKLSPGALRVYCKNKGFRRITDIDEIKTLI